MLIKTIKKRLLKHKNLFLIRERNITKKIDNNRILMNGKLCVDFSSNDYLGLRKHPAITEAFVQSAKKYGIGSGASTFITGYTDEHAETECLFSKWLGTKKAVLFNSGYCANTGIISALINKSDTALSDKLCHASLLDGIALSKAKHYRYKHGDITDLHQKAESNLPSLIVTESVFSMEGRLAPIPSLTKLAKQYQSGLLIDDAHGIGILGKTGAGIAELYNLNEQDYSCLVLPLGKAFNATGAIVTGHDDIIEAILQFSKAYRYTTAMPPAICCAIQATLKIICEETWRRQRPIENIRFFISYAISKELHLLSYDETPIKPILIHDNTKLMALHSFLLLKGFCVSAIRPPTVPQKAARLRISLNSLHTQDEIMTLIDNIVIGLRTY